MHGLFKTSRYTFTLLYRSSRLLIIFYLILQLVGAMLPLASAYILKDILNSFSASVISVNQTMFYIIMYVAAIILTQIDRSAMEVCYDSINNKGEHMLTCDLSKKLIRLPISFVDSVKGKNLIDEVNHLKPTAVYFPNYIVQIASHLCAFIVAFSQLASFSLCFSLLFLALTIPGIFIQAHFKKRADTLRRKTAPDVRKFSYYRWMLTDAWPAKDVRMYDLTEPIKDRYAAEKKIYREANKKLDKKRVSLAMFAELVLRSGEIVFSVYVVMKAIKGEINIGETAMYIGFAISAATFFQNIAGTILYGVVRSVHNMKYLFEFFELETNEALSGTRHLDSFASLVFDDVYFKYPTSVDYVLSGVSFTIEKGDKLAIVGVNGAGKSTIIKLMLGLYKLESGRIMINGYSIADYDMCDVTKLFSVLFQNFVKYPVSLRENVAMSSLGDLDNDAAIETVLRQSGVYDELLPKLADGFDSYMTRQFDDRGTELSNGQWQKIALARAYYKNASIIIFDEPSSALDAEAEDRIFRDFENIAQGKTGIMISHRISSARIANKVIVLDGGKICESGTHDELVAHGGLYAKLYNMQREKYMV